MKTSKNQVDPEKDACDSCLKIGEEYHYEIPFKNGHLIDDFLFICGDCIEELWSFKNSDIKAIPLSDQLPAVQTKDLNKMIGLPSPVDGRAKK